MGYGKRITGGPLCLGTHGTGDLTPAFGKGTFMSDFEEPAINLGSLRQALQKEYTEVAVNPKRGFQFHTGRPLPHMLEYPDEWLIGIPESAIESFAGTGNPFSLGELRPGQRVVDVGAGAGLDSLIAAKKVGPYGRVIGVDMTQAMLEKARRAAKEAGLKNVEFREGYAEGLPVEDGWADVVISNGVLILVPHKAAALEEMFRVLKAGGRLQIGDTILLQEAVPEGTKHEIERWGARMPGALPPAELEATVVAAGFVGFEITWRKDIFGGVPQAGSAQKSSTWGANFWARKAANKEE